LKAGRFSRPRLRTTLARSGITRAAAAQARSPGASKEPPYLLKIQAQRELHIPHGLGDVEDLTRGIAGIRVIGYEVGKIGKVENVEILPPELQIGAVGHTEILK
jgi:hypothetical protein